MRKGIFVQHIFYIIYGRISREIFAFLRFFRKKAETRGRPSCGQARRNARPGKGVDIFRRLRYFRKRMAGRQKGVRKRGGNVSVFEAGMLICFGVAWPISLVKSYRSRSTGGKSPVFSMVIILGYVFGIIHKLQSGTDIVLALYLLNLLMVAADLALWFRNRHLEKAADRR